MTTWLPAFFVLVKMLNYLPEKTTIMSRPKLYIFFKCDQRRQVFLRHDSFQ